MRWHEHEQEVFRGTERLFRPVYADQLTDEWIPALEGVETTLQEGARVADVGCDHAASTVIMAGTYPESTFVGFDYQGGSIDVARERAEEPVSPTASASRWRRPRSTMGPTTTW